MPNYEDVIKKNKDKGNNNKIPLKDLTDEQRAKLAVKHYTLHIPATATKEQLQFITNTAKAVVDNQPITLVHEEAMKRLLKWSYFYRNILTEFDEQERWSEEDEADLNKIASEFKPILDWLVERYKLDIGKFRRD